MRAQYAVRIKVRIRSGVIVRVLVGGVEVRNSGSTAVMIVVRWKSGLKRGEGCEQGVEGKLVIYRLCKKGYDRPCNHPNH